MSTRNQHADTNPGYVIQLPKTKKTIKRMKEKGYQTLCKELDRAALEQFDGPLETALIRHQLYQDHWVQLQCCITRLEQKWLDQVTASLLKFMNAARTKLLCPSSGIEKRQIPLAFLSTDGNVELLDKVMPEILGNLDVFLARVSSNKCPNVKAGFQNIAKQLIRQNPNTSRFIDRSRIKEELDDSADDQTGNSRYLSIFDLNTWYQKKAAGCVVLIVLDDIDMFPEDVVKELLFLLSCLKFEYTLLLGMMSGFVPATKFLPRDVVQIYRIEHFSVSSSSERFDAFMDQGLYDLDNAFRLSGRVVQLLRKYFQHSHFSITRLIQAYQMCLVEHFRKPESLLCVADLQRQWPLLPFQQIGHLEFNESFDNVKAFTEVLLAVKKMMKPVPSKSPKKKEKLFLNEFEETKKEMQKRMKGCYDEFKEWHESFIVLYEFGKGLPECPVGKNKLDLYIAVMTGALHKEDTELEISTTPFDKLVKIVEQFSTSEMKARLENATAEIKKFHDRNSKYVEVSLNEGIPRTVINFFDSVRIAEAEDKKAQEAVVSKPAVQKEKRRVRIMKHVDLQQELLKKIEANKIEGAQAFAKVKAEIIQFLQSIRSKVRSIAAIPFAEIFVYDDVEFLRKQLSPNLPKDIHVSLCMPATYLQCICCDTQAMLAASHADLPDTSILYKLYLERTHLFIDLSDLFWAFKSFLAPIAQKRRTSHPSKKAKKNEADYLLRFRQGIAELQFLGLLTRYKRKPDEAAKLSWIFS